MKFLFLSLAKHQTRYFGQLLAQQGMVGRVIQPGELPWPAWRRLPQVLKRIDWPRLVEEKCQERRVKGKYSGAAYRVLLRLELLLMGLRCVAALEREKPDALVVWNGSNRYCQLMLALLGPGTKTFFFENGLLPDTTTLDRKGVNFHNSVPRDVDFYRAYAQRVDVPHDDRPIQLIPRKPRSEGPAPIELPPRFIFIPFQDDRDTQVRLFSPWICSMHELFALAERITGETDWVVVLKEHPSSREQYPELHQRCHSRLMFANGNSTQQLIESSALVVSINSTVGLESVLLNKPLLTLGQAFFNVEQVVMHADSADETLGLLRQFPDWPVDVEARRAFLHYLVHEYCVPGRWQEATAEHLAEVVRRLRQPDV